MIRSLFSPNRPRRSYMEGEDNPPPVSPPTVPPPGPPPAPNPGAGEARFTKADLDRAAAEARRGLSSQLKTLSDQYKSLSENQTLTDQQRQEYQQKYEELNQQVSSKDELHKQELTKIKTELETNAKKWETTATTWQSRFDDMLLTNDLTTAAVNANVFNPKQIVELLKGRSRKVENTGADGKPDGTFHTRVKLSATKDGKPIDLDMTPEDALKWMKDQPEWGNMFIDKATPGLGGITGNGSSRLPDLSPSLSQADYVKNRDKYLAAADAGSKQT